jgi:tRNA(His) 5'-end guanylyltransferase
MSRAAGEVIATRMKAYEVEAAAHAALDRTKPWMARIDGHKFSTFTKIFKGRGKPFDMRIHRAMCATAEDLLTHFPARAAFTFSDEITLVFDACSEEEDVMMFGGKIVKISSLLAGFVSVRFVRHLQAAEWDPATEAKLIARISDPYVHFDARVWNVPTQAEAVENIVWRSLFDCQRNSILNMARSCVLVFLPLVRHCAPPLARYMRRCCPRAARACRRQRRLSHTTRFSSPSLTHSSHGASSYFSAKKMHGVSNNKACGMLRNEGHPWSEMPLCYRYGSWVKKEQFEKHATNQKTGAAVIAIRTRTATRAFRLVGGATTANVAMLFAKFWPTAPGESWEEAREPEGGGDAGGAAAAAAAAAAAVPAST